MRFVHPDAAVKRRAEVLTGMVKAHDITQAQADQTTQEPLPTVKPTSELRPENAWAEHAQQVLLSDPRLGATPQERRDKVLQGGLKVYTTEDPNLQQMIQKHMQQTKQQTLHRGTTIGARQRFDQHGPSRLGNSICQ